MRLLLWIVFLVLIFVAMAFAVSNASQVTLSLWPFQGAWSAPLYAVVACSVVLGLAIGVVYGLVLGGPARRRARALARENAALHAEIGELRVQRTGALRGPGAEDMD